MAWNLNTPVLFFLLQSCEIEDESFFVDTASGISIAKPLLMRQRYKFFLESNFHVTAIQLGKSSRAFVRVLWFIASSEV